MTSFSGLPQTHSSRRSRVNLDEQASLFLRKAYHLVTNCPQSLGGWTEKGDTFLVKDAKLFSERVIPTVYKHNNFSSFVRQLNFYGFRKIKSDLSSAENPCWEFRHPKFIHGMPQLLSEIKRAGHCAVQTDASVTRDTDMLRSSVIEVNEKLQNVDKCLSVLTNLVTALIKASTNPLTSEVSILLQSIDNVCGKKREGIFIENPANDLKRARVIGEATLVDNNYAFFSRCDKIEGDDTNSTGTEALNDCDVKIIPSEQHTDADFDNFLAYIADDDQTPTYDTPGSDPIEFVCAASFPINGRAIAAIERFHNAVSPVLHEPFTRDRFLHTQFVHSKDNSTGHLEQLAGDVPAAFKRITRYRSSENVLQEIIASVEQTRAAPNDYPSAVYVYRTIEQKPGTESPL